MKHIVITGSTRGIGLGLAKSFLNLDCKVTVNGTSQKSVDKAIKELSGKYNKGNIQGFPADVIKVDELAELWDKAVKNFGDIDFWINHAGVGQELKLFWKTDMNQNKKVIETNILGVMNGCTVAFNQMLKQGHGQIFNTEGFGNDGRLQKTLSVYGTSKRAVRYFTRALAKEAEDSDIKVSSFSPGMVVTDFILDPIKGREQDHQDAIKIFNILADKVETVTPFLAEKILNNTKNGRYINWLTNTKIMWRFMSAPIMKRRVVDL